MQEGREEGGKDGRREKGVKEGRKEEKKITFPASFYHLQYTYA